MSEPARVTGSWGGEGGRWAVLVHGGAGARRRAARRSAQIAGARAAAIAAAEVLQAGGSALDAVERAVVMLEDDPNFNAGTGACLNEEGLIELDAAIMEGAALRGGGVCALPPFLNPIAVARAVLDEGRHVLYAGEGAARFARERGFTPSTSEAMTTPDARARWQANLVKRGAPAAGPQGTVGAVARDWKGRLAAATSTGGVANKRTGRVGDSAASRAPAPTRTTTPGPPRRRAWERRSSGSASRGPRSTRCARACTRRTRHGPSLAFSPPASEARGAHPGRPRRTPRMGSQHASHELGRRRRAAPVPRRGDLTSTGGVPGRPTSPGGELEGSVRAPLERDGR